MGEIDAATDPVGPTGALAHWVAGLSRADVPDAVRERAAHLLLDGVGCALIGAGLPWSRVATDAVLALEGDGDAVVIGTGRTTSAPAAAVLNGTFIQGFELDDFHPLAPLHSCSLLIPALLSTAALLPTPVSAWTSCTPRSPDSRSVRESATRCTAPRCSIAVGIPVRCSAPTARRWQLASYAV